MNGRGYSTWYTRIDGMIDLFDGFDDTSSCAILMSSVTPEKTVD